MIVISEERAFLQFIAEAGFEACVRMPCALQADVYRAVLASLAPRFMVGVVGV